MTENEKLIDAAQRLVDVIYSEAEITPYILPLRGMRAASDLRAALGEREKHLPHPHHEPQAACRICGKPMFLNISLITEDEVVRIEERR